MTTEYLAFFCPICGETVRMTRTDYDRKRRGNKSTWKPACCLAHAMQHSQRVRQNLKWRTNS